MTTRQPSRKRVAVLGGGIAGLAAAYTLARARQAGAPVEEMVVEGRERLGGVIRTEHVEGFLVEAGPDSFLAEKPEAAALAREFGAESVLGAVPFDPRIAATDRINALVLRDEQAAITYLDEGYFLVRALAAPRA